MCVLLAKKLVKNSCHRCINSNLISQRQFFSSTVRARLFRSNRLKSKICIGFSGFIVTSAVGYISLNQIENYKKFDELIDKINEFLNCIGNSLIVNCDSELKQNRTAFYEETINFDTNGKQKEKFEWIEFFKLIWKEKFYLLTAIVVRNLRYYIIN